MNNEKKFAPINEDPLTAIFSGKYDYQSINGFLFRQVLIECKQVNTAKSSGTLL
jgi:hypothetical protein